MDAERALSRDAELHYRELVFSALDSLGSSVNWGGTVLPCRLSDEEHNAVYVQKNKTVLVAYFCSSRWWGVQLSPELLESLKNPKQRFAVTLMLQTMTSPLSLMDFPGEGPQWAAGALAYAVEQVDAGN